MEFSSDRQLWERQPTETESQYNQFLSWLERPVYLRVSPTRSGFTLERTQRLPPLTQNKLRLFEIYKWPKRAAAFDHREEAQENYDYKQSLIRAEQLKAKAAQVTLEKAIERLEILKTSTLDVADLKDLLASAVKLMPTPQVAASQTNIQVNNYDPAEIEQIKANMYEQIQRRQQAAISKAGRDRLEGDSEYEPRGSDGPEVRLEVLGETEPASTHGNSDIEVVYLAPFEREGMPPV